MTPSQERAPQDIEHALYEALKAYERGDLAGERVAVGILPAPLSAVFLRVEKAIEAKLHAHGLAERRAALDSILIGGNHLANVLIGKLGGGFASKFPPTMDHQDALRLIGPNDEYEVWCCWAAIMRARDALALPGDDHA